MKVTGNLQLNVHEHACLIRRDEVYLACIPHSSAGVDRRGLLLLATFPLLSPLPLPHPPSFTLSAVWNSFPRGCFHHHISVLLTQPSFSVIWQASVLPSFSSSFCLTIHEAGHSTQRSVEWRGECLCFQLERLRLWGITDAGYTLRSSDRTAYGELPGRLNVLCVESRLKKEDRRQQQREGSV